MSKFALKMAFAAVVFSLLHMSTVLYVSSKTEQIIYLPALIGVSLMGFWLFYVWVDNNHAHSLRNIIGMVRSFAEGDLTPSVLVNSKDELGQLNSALNEMAENMQRNRQLTIRGKDQIETILASMVEGVLAFDTTGRLILINKAAEEMLNVRYKEVANRYFLEILRNHQMADLLKRCLSDLKRQAFEIKISAKEPEYYRVYITPILGKDQLFQGAVMVLRNVTKVKLLEQVRSDFVANASHEMSTPLTSIKGYVETLLDGAMENRETARKFLNIINSEADRLSRLVTDLLYLSELETGRMTVVKEWYDSQRLIDKAVDILKPVAMSKNVTIESIVHPEAKSIYCNPEMIEQVLINLLENAIKYSYDQGVVRVEIGLQEGETYIKVNDRGIGIPAESLSRIFERFYRVDKARSRKIGGTGLGLSIVKHIADRHRGRVLVESEEEKGTTFTVLLPVK